MSPRPSSSPCRTSLALALVLASAGCSHTKVSKQWSEPALKEGTYGKVMVLVLLPAYGKRQTAEDRIVAELVRQGATAVRSWDVLSQEDLAERERIRAAVAASGADALMAVRVVSLAHETEVNQGREQWVPVGTGMDYYGYVTTSYGLYRRPEIAESRSAILETTLWDLRSTSVVWGCQSESTSLKETITTSEVADDYAGVVAKRVRPYLRGR